MKTKTKKRLGLVAVLLVLILAIGAAAGTTLAKYISSATKTTEIATVAKWGYTITTNGAELFSEQYDHNTIVKADNETLDVVAEGKVVAPGTSSVGAKDNKLTFTINGSSQVDAHLVIDIKAFETVWLNYNETTYYPLNWTITAGDGEYNSAEISFEEADTDKLAETLASEMAKNLKLGVLPEGIAATDVDVVGSKVIIELAAGVEFDNYVLSLAWNWELSNGHDVEDTILGWKADGVTGDQYTSADNGETLTKVELDEIADEDFNLDLKVEFRVYIEQVQTGHAHKA